MPLGNTDNLKLLLNTSNFRQATTIAFICLLVALASIILCNHLLEIVMRSHVREMILADVRSQQLHGNLQKTEQVLSAMNYREPFEIRKDRPGRHQGCPPPGRPRRRPRPALAPVRRPAGWPATKQ